MTIEEKYINLMRFINYAIEREYTSHNTLLVLADYIKSLFPDLSVGVFYGIDHDNITIQAGIKYKDKTKGLYCYGLLYEKRTSDYYYKPLWQIYNSHNELIIKDVKFKNIFQIIKQELIENTNTNNPIYYSLI